MVAEGRTVQLGPVVPGQVPPDQEYEVAAGLHDAVSTEVPPAAIELGEATRVHTGTLTRGETTVIVVLAVPLPPELLAATV